MAHPRWREQRDVAADRRKTLQLAEISSPTGPASSSLGKLISATKTGSGPAMRIDCAEESWPAMPCALSSIKTSVASANSAFSNGAEALSPRPSASNAPFRSKKSNDRASDRASALVAEPRRTKAHLAGEFPRRQAERKPGRSRKVARSSLPPGGFVPERRANPDQTRSQRDMIFAQRIAQLDRFPRKACA